MTSMDWALIEKIYIYVSDSKESTCSAGDLGSIPGLGRSWRAWPPTPVFLPGECPWTEESGGLQSMGSQRVKHDWATKHSIVQEDSRKIVCLVPDHHHRMSYMDVFGLPEHIKKLRLHYTVVYWAYNSIMSKKKYIA